MHKNKFSSSYCVSCKSIFIPRYTEMRYLIGNTRDMKISWVLIILFDNFFLARILVTTLYITRQIYYWKKWWVTRKQVIHTLILFCISYRSKTDKPYSNLYLYTQLFKFTYCSFINETLRICIKILISTLVNHHCHRCIIHDHCHTTAMILYSYGKIIKVRIQLTLTKQMVVQSTN